MSAPAGSKATTANRGMELHRRLNWMERMCREPKLCDGCYQNYADSPSRLCPGCQAYGDHTS